MMAEECRLTDDSRLCLALAHAKFHTAAELLRLAMNTESNKLVDRDELLALIDSIAGYGNRCFNEMRPK